MGFPARSHLVSVGDEVGREVTAVELHAFNDVEFGFEAFGFFDGDNAFVANLLHRFSNHLANGGFAIGRDRADLGNLGRVFDLLGALFRCQQRLRQLVDAALQIHRVHAGSNGLAAFADDRLSQNGGSGGAVAGFVIGRERLREPSVRPCFRTCRQLDFFGDGHAVFRDAGCAERLVDHNVAAFRAEGDFNGVCRACSRL